MTGEFVAFFVLSMTAVGVSSSKHCVEEYELASSTASLVCEHLTDENELYYYLTYKPSDHITELQVINSSLRYFRHGTFHGRKIKEIHIEGSSLLSFANNPVAFDGLQDYLELLTIEECTFVNRLNWNTLREMKQLEGLLVRSSDMVYIPDLSALSENSKIKVIAMTNNAVTDIDPNAFEKMENLKYVYLGHNKITSFERSMLPNPAKIAIISLSYNHLEMLPEDMFSNMPLLRNVYLHNNHLTTICEKVFGGVISQLLILQMDGNPTSCDCRLRWILKAEHRSDLRMGSACTKPPNLKDRNVLDLKSSELWC